MRVVIIDDDKLVASSLKTIVSSSGEIDVIAVGHSSEEAVNLYIKHKPDLMLLDIRMGDKTGIDAAMEIYKIYNDAKILFLTTFADDEYILSALNIGVKGYILKQNYESIVPAIKAVISGHTVFGEEIISRIPVALNYKNIKQDILEFDLIEKEYEIVKLVAKGLSNKEISNELHLSEGTVRNYISLILEKLYLRDRTQLAIFYYKNFN
ncbi:MAG TPA: response regulator transcription factor [Clostridiales bacterium]|nr:response regulator transcription factor [Clostridiales bacterium]